MIFGVYNTAKFYSRNPGFIHNSRRFTHRKSIRDHVSFIFDNPLPLGAGALVVGLLQLKRIRDREINKPEGIAKSVGKEDSQSDLLISCYESLPLRHISRAWGFVNDIYLPKFSRQFILGWYAKSFNCDLSEAEEENLDRYENLGQFFRRGLKTGCRPIDSREVIVSPCDGKLLHKGEVTEDGRVEQVKGVSYSLQSFLGYGGNSEDAKPADIESRKNTESSSDYLVSPERVLYQCVLYLAPGDYHRFHSPVSWVVRRRRHFPGHLLSVSPSVVSRVPGLFSVNERVVYTGQWDHGFFSMTAVGATNVGSVVVAFDPSLKTNLRKWEKDTFHQVEFKDGASLEKGDPFGEFNLGSTIVLIFEAPKDFEFSSLESGSLVRVGKPLCEPMKTTEEVSDSETADVNELKELIDANNNERNS